MDAEGQHDKWRGIDELLHKSMGWVYSAGCPVAMIAELLGNNGMAEMNAEEFDGSNLADEGLQDHIAHWAEVLDRWVRGIDRGLGRQDGAAIDPDQESQPPLDGIDAGSGAQQ